jgi:hypothetical protein
MDSSEIDNDLFLFIPDDNSTFLQEQLPPQVSPNTSPEVTREELLPFLDHVSGLQNPPMSGFLGGIEGFVNPDDTSEPFSLIQTNPTHNVEVNDPMDIEYPIYQTSEGQVQQNVELITAVDTQPTSTYFIPPIASEDDPSSAAVILGTVWNPEWNPEYDWPANDTTLGLQQSPAQLWQPPITDQVQYSTASASFNNIQANSQPDLSFREAPDLSYSHSSPLNIFSTPLVTSPPIINESLSTSFSSIPNRQQILQPEPIESYQTRPSSSILSTNQGLLANTTSPTVTGEHRTIIRKPVVLPDKHKAKRKPTSSAGTANEPQSKKMRKSATKEYLPYIHTFPLPANPSKDNVPQKKNKWPCLRCKAYRKGVCPISLSLQSRSD